jgi:short-chain Z-isoprenyl diphosphate synthase
LGQTESSLATLNCFAIGYGGREEILDALRRWADEPAVRDQNARVALWTLTATDLARNLYAADLADPDLILRTSGEIRLSGFLLWQSVHAEFYFTDVLWPEFREIDFLRALRDYQRRSRRFGR